MSAAAIMALVAGAGELIKLAMQVRDAARKNGEWTPDQEVEFQAKLKATFSQEHWTSHG